MEDINRTRRTLLERLRDGSDEESWLEFVNTYKIYICVVISRMGVNDADTEDLAQQVMLKLWKLLPDFTYEGKKRFRSYLSRVTKNVVHDFFRSRTAESKRIEKVYKDKLNQHEVPEIEHLIDEEWDKFVANLAFSNIRKSQKENAVTIFERVLNGEDAEKVGLDYGLKKNSVHQTYKRVKDKIAEEIIRLKKDLE